MNETDAHELIDGFYRHLAVITESVDLMLSETFGVLNKEQDKHLRLIRYQSAEWLPSLCSGLLQLLIERDFTLEEGIRCMSMEWRGPITSMLGFSTWMSRGIFGTVTEDQAQTLQHIAAHAKKLWGYSNPNFTLPDF
jgi:hypothetical protein